MPQDGVRVTVEESPSDEDVAVVWEGLLAFNVERIGDPRYRAVSLFARDASGTVVGGLLGEIRWRWLYVGKLWVDAAHRGSGAGTRLLLDAEAYAREQGCIGAALDTFDYQARPFYERHGYTLFGTLDDYPPGGRQYFLSKRLAASG